MRGAISSQDLAYCGLFGAASLLLPGLFHLVQLGRVFMPMYIPLIALAFLVRPLPASTTALLTPLLSGALPGMPPFYPPVAICMSLELSAMAALISSAIKFFPNAGALSILLPVLFVGRILYMGLTYAFSLLIDLPAEFMAGLSLVSGWPGLLLMALVVPSVVRTGKARARKRTVEEESTR